MDQERERGLAEVRDKYRTDPAEDTYVEEQLIQRQSFGVAEEGIRFVAKVRGKAEFAR